MYNRLDHVNLNLLGVKDPLLECQKLQTPFLGTCTLHRTVPDSLRSTALSSSAPLDSGMKSKLGEETGQPPHVQGERPSLSSGR